MSGEILERTNDVELYELSMQQKRLWERCGGAEGERAAIVFRLRGACSEEALRRAVRSLVARHEILRTTFERQPGVRFPFQAVHADREPLWSRSDREQEHGEASVVEELLERGAGRRGEDDPPVRAHWERLGDERSLLLLSLPVLCSDPTSAANLQTDLAAALARPDAALDGELLQYADFAAWQEELTAAEPEPEDEEGRSFWRDQRTTAPVAAVTADGGHRRHDRACGELAADLRTAARELGVPVPSLVLSSWMVLLARCGEAGTEARITVARLFSGRPFEELANGVGPFALHLPISAEVEGGTPLANLATAVAAAEERGQEWQDVAHLEGLGHPDGPVFDLAFAACSAPRPRAGGAVRVGLADERHPADGARLRLQWTDHREGGGPLLWIESVAEGPRTAVLLERLSVLLGGIASDPRRQVGDYPILAPAEAREVLCAGIGPPVPAAEIEPAQTFVARFEEWARRKPDHVALAGRSGCWSFGAVDRAADALAVRLMEHDVERGDRVAVLLERRPETLVVFLAILKAAAAYVPLDRAQPAERLGLALESAGARLVVTDGEAELPEEAPPALEADWSKTVDRGVGDGASRRALPEDLAYVLFTSGTTGRPKGVAVEHRQVTHYLHGILQELGPEEGAHWATVSTFAADLGNTAILPALATGGCLHVIPDSVVLDPAAMADYCESRGIDHLKIVPSHLGSLMAADGGAGLLPGRTLVLGGEVLGRELVEEVGRLRPDLVVFNHYGPTEATVGALIHRVAGPGAAPAGSAEAALPIGRPLAGTRAHLVNDRAKLVPVGVPGYLHLGGGGLARGYLGGAAETAARFLPDPFAETPGQRLYATGDRARLLPGGTIEFLGRTDHQVKVRGFRIELGEIEQVLSSHPLVREAVVVLRGTDGGEPTLLAYAVPRKVRGVEAGALLTHLAERVPDYMVPSQVVLLDAMPLNANGKLDRAALPEPSDREDRRGVELAPPTSLTELELVKIWEGLLGGSVGVDESFFEIGGHSLLAVQLMARIESVLGSKLPLATLYRAPTITELARVVDARGSETGAQSSPIVLIQEGDDRNPFFCVHPMGGEVLCYHGLARAMGRERPFYGLQAVDDEVDGGPDSIEEMARRYVDALLEVVPKEGHLLGGYSFGSKVAFAMAQELERRGERVGFVALLDGGAPSKAVKSDRIEGSLIVAQSIREEARIAGRDFDLSFDHLQSLPENERLPFVLDAAKAAGLLPEEIEERHAEHFLDGLEHRMRISEHYHPEPWSGPIALFRSSERDEQWHRAMRDAGYDTDDPTKGWARFVRDPLEIVHVPGYHETLLSSPSVEVLAEQLNRALARAERRAPRPAATA